MRMPFGKHVVVELAAVPRQCLWLLGQPWLIKEIDDVLSGEAVTPSHESFEEALKRWKEAEHG
jgi:hypothetical protein